VIITATARLVVNPAQVSRESMDGYSAVGSLNGFTLPELAVLHTAHPLTTGRRSRRCPAGSPSSMLRSLRYESPSASRLRHGSQRASR